MARRRAPSPSPPPSDGSLSPSATESEDERGAPRRRSVQKKAMKSVGKGETEGTTSKKTRTSAVAASEDEEKLLGTSSEESAPSDSEEDSKRSASAQSRLRSSKGSCSDSAPPPKSNRRLVLICGLLVILLLALIAGYFIWKQSKGDTADSATDSSSATNSSSSASGAGAGGGVTVTVTAASNSTATVTVTVTAGASPVATATASKAPPSAQPSGSGGVPDPSDLGLTGSHTGISRNGIGLGFLPDYQDQDMAAINEGLGLTSAYLGWYAQLPADGADWDGSQLLSQMDDIKASGAIFQPAVMPTKGWKGLTADDNAQALSIAKVMKQFTDAGIIVWLRFAHEVNWYQTDGTYKGDVDDFKAGWAAVAAAVADNPKVLMFFTPNIASMEEYKAFFPDDHSTVHIIGIDYYPKSSSDSFVEHMKPFYDAYCADGSIKFAIGETGNGWHATIEERLAWLDQTTSAETAAAMPHYIGVAWFNYMKGVDFRLWEKGNEDVNGPSKKWFGEGTEAMGGKIGSA